LISRRLNSQSASSFSVGIKASCNFSTFVRQRSWTLSSYCVANPERLPHRIIGLLHRVTRIEWDECRTDEAARNREELLLCVLNPRFNGAANVWPRQ